MKDLLTKLQSFPIPWGRFIKSTKKIPNEYFIYPDNYEMFLQCNDLTEYEAIAVFEKLLTDFCDGEGYYVFVGPTYAETLFYVCSIHINNKTNWGFHCQTEVKPSRQEAFNAGVVKSFSLMEERNK